jgi:cytochrome c oxidase subunit 2
MVMFLWGAALYVTNSTPPPGALEIYVVGKQWMWKIQHPEGQREINELHLPIGQPVKLIMASQDVIHSFYVPAFRVKQDVIPGRFSTMWFQPTRTGTYHLFCAEYCGNQHSGMVGRVVVMEPADYQTWLSGEVAGETMISAGEKLFERLACSNCHKPGDVGRGPSILGIFGKSIRLQTGDSIVADEAYIRESIIHPGAKIVQGYPNIMPTFKGLISEEGLMQIVAYIKSQGAGGSAK